MFIPRKAVPILFATLALAGLGCSSGFATDPGAGKRVEITVARDAYVPGDTVVVTIRNVSGVQWNYSLCHLMLQRYQNGTWTAASTPSQGCTTTELPFLGPGQTMPLIIYLPSNTPAGGYRLSIQPDVTTPQFTVSAGTPAVP